MEMHDKETDIFYVTDGAATFITGGKIRVGAASPVRANGWVEDIVGGEVQHLIKGNIIVIRAGDAPFVQGSFLHSVNYFVVKVLKRSEGAEAIESSLL